MKALFQHKGVRWGFRSALLLYIVFLIILPITGIYSHAWSGGWNAFWNSITEPLAWKSVWLTFKLAVYATIINAVIGTICAWSLHRYTFPGRTLLNSLVDLPFALPTAVGGLMILLLLGPSSLLGAWADSMGWRLVFAEPAIVTAMVFVTFPFVIRAIQPLLEEADASQEEAAHTLGASKWRTFRNVLFPQIRPGIVSGSMLAFSRALAEFGAVVLIAGNIPGKTLIASVYIFGEMESDHTQGAAAVSIILLTLSFILLWVMNTIQAQEKKA